MTKIILFLLFTLVWSAAYWWVLNRMARNLDRHRRQKGDRS